MKGIKDDKWEGKSSMELKERMGAMELKGERGKGGKYSIHPSRLGRSGGV